MGIGRYGLIMVQQLYTAVRTLAGSGGYSDVDGIGTSASLSQPYALWFATRQTRDVLFFTSNSHVVRQVDLTTRAVSYIAGKSDFLGYNGDKTFSNTYFNYPKGIWYHPSRDELYVVDSNNQRIRRLVFSTQTVQTVVGTGESFVTTTDEQGTSTHLSFPSSLVGDTNTNKLYLTDSGNGYIKEYDIATGMTKNIAGGGSFYQFTTNPVGDNGVGTSAYMHFPLSLWKYNTDLYITELAGGRIRKLNLTTGIISTVAGNVNYANNYGYYGDGGNAADAQLNTPSGGMVDSAGKNIYFADQYNNMIRKIDITTNIITRYAGKVTTSGYFDDIEGINATNALFSLPNAVVYDTNRNVFYVSDTDHNRIRTLSVQPFYSLAPTLFPTRLPSRMPTLSYVTYSGHKASFNLGNLIYIIIVVVLFVCALIYRTYIIRKQQEMKVGQDVMMGGYPQQPGGMSPQPYQPGQQSGIPQPYSPYPQPTPMGQQINPYPSANGGTYPGSAYPSSNPYPAHTGPSYPDPNNPYNPYASAQASAYSSTPVFATATVFPASTPSYGGTTNTNNSYSYSAIPAVSTSSSAATYGGFAGVLPQDHLVAIDDDTF